LEKIESKLPNHTTQNYYYQKQSSRNRGRNFAKKVRKNCQILFKIDKFVDGKIKHKF
jgi:hypothetical protein